MNLILTLFGAFSFLLPGHGRLPSILGFFDENPAASLNGQVWVGGELGSLDSKTVQIGFSKRGIFVLSQYENFGALEVQDDIPDDNSMFSVWPYLFSFEVGGHKAFGKTITGISICAFEQRMLEHRLRGYFVNFGVSYRWNLLSLHGFLRNMGGRVGYVEREKYPLPVYGFLGVRYKNSLNSMEFGVSSVGFHKNNVIFHMVYARKLYKFLWMGGELMAEKDLSFGYKYKYPIGFMLKANFSRKYFGYMVNLPEGGFDIRHILYLGVEI